MGTKGSVTSGVISGYVEKIVLVVILFLIIAALFPTLTSSGSTLNASGFPLGSLFVSGGAVWYLLAAGVIFLLIRSFMPKTGK